MLILKNDTLTVSILDPVSDRALLGSRYCTGCYLWQVCDSRYGELFAGPEYPVSKPLPFNGQGAPDAFEIAPGHEHVAPGESLMVIGVGQVLRSSPVHPFHVRDNPTVLEFCTWAVQQPENDCITMKTTQAFGEWEFDLERLLRLSGRTVSLTSTVTNRCGASLPVRWFAHPFFPKSTDSVCCKFSLPVQTGENRGFFIDSNDYLCMNSAFEWEKGCYRKLIFAEGNRLSVIQRHPVLGEMHIDCDFPVAELPVWANAITFSFEPYFESFVHAEGSARWTIRYRF